MKKIYLGYLLLLIWQTSSSQSIERKIIVDNNIFYFCTIDNDLQLATLHQGKVSNSLSSSKHYALPAGRSFEEPVNPFSWDISSKLFYAVNFLNNPNNNKNESLRRISLSSIHKQDTSKTSYDMLDASLYQNNFATNAPYQFIRRKETTFINKFFFDGIILHDSVYAMAITNNNELTIWNYDGGAWKHGEIKTMNFDDYFTLFTFRKKLYMILNKGEVFEISIDSVTYVKTIKKMNLKECTLIINRSDNTIKYINNNSINYKMPLSKLIKEKAIQIF